MALNAHGVRVSGESRQPCESNRQRSVGDVSVVDGSCVLKNHPNPICLIGTTSSLGPVVLTAIKDGVVGIVDGGRLETDLVVAVRSLAAGEGYLSSTLVKPLLRWLSTTVPERSHRFKHLHRLSSREREVLKLLGDGLSSTEIGSRLHISAPTVRSHISHLIDKLELRDKTEAVLFGREFRTMLAVFPDAGREDD